MAGVSPVQISASHFGSLPTFASGKKEEFVLYLIVSWISSKNAPILPFLSYKPSFSRVGAACKQSFCGR
ncbi:hypothetical protein OPV22_017546 [Ensete ventricosum]|uniref:Uncharacterized protein n=1 Tax=Ensete ventricosum TaxID=4639 RepID=A0AAV8PHV2_ENSVE|nr:hypothetical protein OPV22_017546 [Ensete ventricosum]